MVLDISKATPELYDAEKLDVHALLPGNSRVTESVDMPTQGDVNVTLRIPLKPLKSFTVIMGEMTQKQ